MLADRYDVDLEAAFDRTMEGLESRVSAKLTAHAEAGSSGPSTAE